MSPQISEEVTLLLMSMYGGLILILSYDVIRVFRRLFAATVVRVIVEDIIFWITASMFMFNILLKYNYGRPRYFAIGAALGVMVLFEWLVGRHLIDKSSNLLKKILNTLLKPLKKLLKMIKLKKRKAIGSIRKKGKKWHSEEEVKEDRRRHLRRQQED